METVTNGGQIIWRDVGGTMSKSLNVIFLRDRTDPQYQKLLRVFLACQDAGVNLPKEVDDYFGGDGEDNDFENPLRVPFKPRNWQDDDTEGFEIDINQIPLGVKTIRVYISW